MADTWLMGTYGSPFTQEEEREFNELLEYYRIPRQSIVPDDFDTPPAANADLAYFRLCGIRKGFRDEAGEGDQVIQILRKTEGDEPQIVHRPARIFKPPYERHTRRTWYLLKLEQNTINTATSWQVFKSHLNSLGVKYGGKGGQGQKLTKHQTAALRRLCDWEEETGSA